MLLAQSRHPGGVGARCAPRGGIGERGERQCGARKYFHHAAAVLAQLLPVVADADEARAGKHRRRTIAELIVELAADDHDQIGLLHDTPAQRAHDRGVIGGNEAAALLRVEIGGVGRVQKSHQLSGGPQGAAPGHHQRDALRRR